MTEEAEIEQVSAVMLSQQQKLALGMLIAQIRRDAANLLIKAKSLESILGLGGSLPEQIAVRCIVENDGMLIHAIKAYRQETGAGLKEAKDAINAAKATLGMQ